MANLVRRFFGKKRGGRNMRSDTLGGAWLGGFFAVVFLLGCAALAYLMAEHTIPDWRANRDFLLTTCTIESKEVAVEGAEPNPLYRPVFRVCYEVDGRTFRQPTYDLHETVSSDRAVSEQILGRFDVGRQYPCWYNPAEPARVVLVKGYSWYAWLLLVLPISFMVIGGGGLAYTWVNWGKSAERRAVLAQRAMRARTSDDTGDDETWLPHVPHPSTITNSAGTTLAYRLPTASLGWNLLGTIAIAIFWNTIVGIFVTIVVRDHADGRHDWFLTLMLVPFVLIGGALAAVAGRQLIVATGVGPTLVEIDQHPLRPGATYQVYVAQTGRLTLHCLRMALVCDEEATYRQGTNLRTAHARVFEQELLLRENVDVRHGQPFEARCELHVPPAAMHSFKASHNKITWKLVVAGKAARWPPFERAYALLVYPPADEELPA